MQKLLTAVAAFAALALSGCATLMNGSTQAVNIRTDPPGAICEVEEYVILFDPYNYHYHKYHKSAGVEKVSIASIVTPGIVVLKRDDSYSVSCQSPGYKKADGEIKQALVDWPYLFGNIFLGLIPGLTVDSMTGAANRLVPSMLDVKMERIENTQDMPEHVAPPPTPPATK